MSKDSQPAAEKPAPEDAKPEPKPLDSDAPAGAPAKTAAGEPKKAPEGEADAKDAPAPDKPDTLKDEKPAAPAKPAAAKPAATPPAKPAAAKPAATPPAKPAAAKPAATPPAKPAAAKPAATPPAKPAAAKPAAAKPSPAAKKAPPPPPAPPEFEKGISDRILERFGDRVESTFIKPGRIGIKAGRDDVHSVAEFIRDDLSYDHVESVSGVDYAADGEIEVVYHIGSYTDDSLENQIIALSTRAQREDDPIPGGDATRLPTLRDVFYSVEFHEREIFEMFGVYFEGHPDNRRLLLPEDWADLPPLRKDFAIKGR